MIRPPKESKITALSAKSSFLFSYEKFKLIFFIFLIKFPLSKKQQERQWKIISQSEV